MRIHGSIDRTGGVPGRTVQRSGALVPLLVPFQILSQQILKVGKTNEQVSWILFSARHKYLLVEKSSIFDVTVAVISNETFD
jgi:hypothetical protein